MNSTWPLNAETRLCSTAESIVKKRLPAEEQKIEDQKINAIWTSACVAGNPNTTAVDFPPDYGRFVIPPVAYQQTPWLERPTAGFNPIFPWIDANIQQAMNDAEEISEDCDQSEAMECSTKRTYQPNVFL